MTHHLLDLLEKKLSKSKPELIRRTLAIGVVALMFQGSSSALTSAWAAGCVENPNFCVVSTGDESIVFEDQHTLRSAVASANAVGGAQTIGFADELFGITRTDGVITGSSANANNPVVITLQSTLEIRSDLTIKAPTLDESPQILKIVRGTEIASGAPLIAVNPTVNGVPASEGATTQVTIESVIIDSNANPNSGGDPRSTPGVAIEVKSTTLPENPVELTPELVVKNSQIVNSVSDSGGAAINTTGNVVVENSLLSYNMATTPDGGPASDGGAILAAGSVTVAGSTLTNNSATGNGGAISASSVVVTAAEVGATSQLIGNTAGGNGGAVSSSGALDINENYTEIRDNVAGGNGGALSAGGTVTIGNEVSITDNHAGQIRYGDYRYPTLGGNGGAISAGDTVTVTNTTLSHNSAHGSFEGDGPATGSGGAIATDGAVIVRGSILNHNWSSGVGGAIYGDAVTVESALSNHIIGNHVVNSEMSRNFAAEDGGAIFAYGPVSVMAEAGSEEHTTVFSENQTGDLGGAIFSDSSVALDNVRVSGNRAQSDGGGVWSSGSISVVNSYLGENVAGTLGDVGEPLEASETGGSGGALYASETITVNNSTFQSNIALRGISDSRGDGGAIFAEGTVTVSGSTLQGNDAGRYGGAIFTDQVTLQSSGEVETVISGNHSGWEGGGIYATTVTIENSRMQFNASGAVRAGVDAGFAPSGEGGDGGAIFAEGAVTITNSTFEANTAVASGDDSYGRGGAIKVQDVSHLIVEDSLFAGNVAGNDGGAIHASEESLVELLRVVFDANTAGDDGGAIDLDSDSELTIFDSLFEANTASGDGGAIDAEFAKIARTTFLQNSAGEDGGALSLGNDGQTVILNSIFSQNIAAEFGGAIYGPAWLMFNDFVGNSAAIASAIALTGRLGTMLVGNILEAPAESETSLCNISFWNTPDNLATDESCFSTFQYNGIEQSVSRVTPDPLTLSNTLDISGDEYTGEIIDLNNCPLISCWTDSGFNVFARENLVGELDKYTSDPEYTSSPELEQFRIELEPLNDIRSDLRSLEGDGYDGSSRLYCLINDFNIVTDGPSAFDGCLAAIDSDIRELENIYNLAELAAGAGDFLRQNFAIDRAGITRPESDFWSVGAIQRIVEDLPVDDSLLNQPPVIENTNQNIQEVRQERRENTISAAEQALRAAADAKRAAELAAAKLAKKEAAAKRAAERKAKLSKVSQKMAATKARGAALKQKIEWITLMKNFVTR